jgi:hypothetical protein
VDLTFAKETYTRNVVVVSRREACLEFVIGNQTIGIKSNGP